MALTADLIKKNMASIVSVVTFITVIIGAAFTFESRYAKASEITELKLYVKQQSDVNHWAVRHDRLQDRKQVIEDQLFQLRLKQNPTQTDKALIERYTDQLKEVTQQLAIPAPNAN